MEGIDSKELTILHGDLIAFNGIEPNAGNVKLVQDGTFSACYRVTHEGLREYRRIHGVEVVEETLETFEPAQPRLPRKRRKNESHAVATSE